MKAHTLHRLAAGSCDPVLDGVIVGSVVREVSAAERGGAWHAELIEDLPPDQRPNPFMEIKHAFPTLDAATAWLGDTTSFLLKIKIMRGRFSRPLSRKSDDAASKILAATKSCFMRSLQRN